MSFLSWSWVRIPSDPAVSCLIACFIFNLLHAAYSHHVFHVLKYVCHSWHMADSWRMISHVLGRIMVFNLLYLYPFYAFSIWKAVIWVIISNATFGLSFMMNSQINHLTEACAHASDTNFFKHQIVTAQNFGVNNAWCTFYSGGLNYQIEVSVSSSLWDGLFFYFDQFLSEPEYFTITYKVTK